MNAAQFSTECNIDLNTVDSMLEAVVNGIVADNLAQQFVDGDEEFRNDCIVLYMEKWIKTINEIAVKYATDDTFRERMQNAVFAIMKRN